MSRFATTWSRIRSTPGLSRDVAMAVGLTVVGVISAVTIFSNYQLSSPFSHQYEFAAAFDKLPAVNTSARQEVRIAGVPVGRISGAEPGRGGAELKMTIEDGHPIYRDARVMLRSKTPLNIMYVAVDPGTPKAGPLPAGGVIPVSQTQRVVQPFELLDQLDTRARAALTDLITQADVALVDAPKQLPKGLSSVDAAAGSFQQVVDALDSRRDNLRRLITAVSQVSAATGADDVRLAKLVAALQRTLGVLSDTDRQLDSSLAQLPGVAQTLTTSLTEAKQLTDQLSPTLDDVTEASAALPGTLDRLADTVDRVRGVAKQAAPVIAQARPVVADLRPLAVDLDRGLADLSPVVSTLPGATAKIVPWLDNLGAFVYNTSSSFSLGDASGGLGRANLILKVYDPLGGGL